MAIPRNISLLGESRNGNLTFLGDRGRQNLFLNAFYNSTQGIEKQYSCDEEQSCVRVARLLKTESCV